MFDDHDTELNIYAVFSSGNHDGITSAKKNDFMFYLRISPYSEVI